MGFFSRFEHHVEDGFENLNDKLFDAPISPVQIAKKAEKQMRREKMVGAGKEFAPTLYTVLVNPDDDNRLFGYYPTLAGETETYLAAKAQEEGLVMDGAPLVRFIVDDELKSGRFDIIAEMVSQPIIMQLRAEEMARYGISQQPAYSQNARVVTPNPVSAAPATPVTPQVQPQYQQVAQPQAPTPAAAPQAGQPQAAPVVSPLVNDPASGLDVFADDPEVNYDAINAADRIAAYTNMPAPDLGGAPVLQQNQATTPSLINLTTGRSFVLANPTVLLGRGVNCDIVLDDLNASRTHAQIQRTSATTWSISDMGSTNGTLLNGRHIAEAPLSEGDRITAGSTTLLFTFNS